VVRMKITHVVARLTGSGGWMDILINLTSDRTVCKLFFDVLTPKSRVLLCTKSNQKKSLGPF
ncbi:hypothetical protein J6590_031812, partial [Homalodisca vitripennis]